MKAFSLRTLCLFVLFLGFLQLHLFNCDSWEFVGAGKYLRYSPELKRGVVEDANGKLEVLELTRALRKIATSIALPESMKASFSIDLNHVATGGGTYNAGEFPTEIFELNTSRRISTLKNSAFLGTGSFSPDGQHIIAGGGRSELRDLAIYNVASGDRIKLIPDSGDGARYLKCGTIESTDWRGKTRVTKFYDSAGTFILESRDWDERIESADGSKIIVNDGKSHALVNLKTRASLSLHPFSHQRGGLESLSSAFSKDGSTLFIHQPAFTHDPMQSKFFVIDAAKMVVTQEIPGITGFDTDQFEAKGSDKLLAFDRITGQPLKDASESGNRSPAAIVYEAQKTIEPTTNGFAVWEHSSSTPLREVFVGNLMGAKLHWIESSRILVIEHGDFLRIYHNRRPEEWWGVFFLWQFWACAAALGGFLWSILHDRRQFGRRGSLIVATPAVNLKPS